MQRAEVLMGSGRQLALVPPSVTAERVPWPSPMTEALPGLLETYADRAVVVLASGDPMLSGIGTTMSGFVPPFSAGPREEYWMR